MQTFRDLIDTIGPGQLAGLFGVSSNHVHTMRARNSIPVEFWQRLIDGAPADLNLNFETLTALRAARRDRVPSA